MPNARKLVVRLKGGLGNQMFQYAAALGLAARHGLDLVVDTQSGFVRDRLYRRQFSLQSFHLPARRANALEQAPFLLESIVDKYVSQRGTFTQRRPWGLHCDERVYRYYPELMSERYDRSLWLDGYWQCEKYFKAIESQVEKAFPISPPADDRFTTLAEGIHQQNAVAIGIRLYEEAPSGAHYTVPFAFYEQMAQRLAKDVERPVFYLFCTVRQPIHEQLALPGVVHYVTHDDGYTGELRTLWLLTQFRYHIMSNSSFYWWGAWLAEKRRPGVQVFASDNFPNPDTIPERWTKQVSRREPSPT